MSVGRVGRALSPDRMRQQPGTARRARDPKPERKHRVKEYCRYWAKTPREAGGWGAACHFISLSQSRRGGDHDCAVATPGRSHQTGSYTLPQPWRGRWVWGNGYGFGLPGVWVVVFNVPRVGHDPLPGSGPGRAHRSRPDRRFRAAGWRSRNRSGPRAVIGPFRGSLAGVGRMRLP